MSVKRRSKFNSEESYLICERRWKANYRRNTGAFINYSPVQWEKWEDKMVLEHSIPDRDLSKKIHRSVSAIQIRRSRLKKGSVG